MLKSAQQALASLKKDASLDRAFFLLNDSEIAREFIKATLVYEHDEQWARELGKQATSQARCVELFERTLLEDLRQRVESSDRDLLDEILIGILPLHRVNGHAQRCDNNNKILDRPLLLVNFGVTHVCNLLAYALTLEILENKLLRYKQSGKNFSI